MRDLPTAPRARERAAFGRRGRSVLSCAPRPRSRALCARSTRRGHQRSPSHRCSAADVGAVRREPSAGGRADGGSRARRRRRRRRSRGCSRPSARAATGRERRAGRIGAVSRRRGGGSSCAWAEWERRRPAHLIPVFQDGGQHLAHRPLHHHVADHAEAFAIWVERLQRLHHQLVLRLVQVHLVDLDRQLLALLAHEIQRRLRVGAAHGRERAAARTHATAAKRRRAEPLWSWPCVPTGGREPEAERTALRSWRGGVALRLILRLAVRLFKTSSRQTRVLTGRTYWSCLLCTT